MSTIPDADTSLMLTRTYPVPSSRVYAVWTDVGLARQWWGPDGCETLELVCESKVGGQFRWVLSTPDGHVMTAEGVFREVQEGVKIAYTWRWTDDPQWDGHESLVTVEFIDQGPDSSELRLTHDHLPSRESRDNHIGGWNGALDKLGRLLVNA